MSRRGVYLGVVFVLLLGLIVCAGLFVLGSIRYGGPDELLLRARIALAARRPHTQFVPTPLPTPQTAATIEPLASRATLATLAITGRVTDEAAAARSTDARHETPATPALPTASRQTTPAALPPPLSSPSPVDTGVVAPQALPTPAATAQPTLTPYPAAAAAPVHAPAAAAIQLTGVTHVWQKWNNCGPATLAMYLSYFGSTLTQAEIAAALKPNWDDKNISPDEVAAFAATHGLQALVRVNGNADRLRRLLSNGLPVLIETWLELEPGDGMGHYRLLTGYDDAAATWTAYDSYVTAGVRADVPYAGIRLPYAEMESLWSVFNRTYVLVYTTDQAPVVASILGEEMSDTVMWQRALASARTELASRPEDPFVQFNLGNDLVAVGQYAEAAVAFDQARVIGLPWRMLWYQFGPFRAYYETGRHAELIALADATIATAGEIEEIYYYKGLGLAALGRPTEARQNWERAVELNPNYAAPAAALATAAGDQTTGRP